jgi:hypothetical protein
MRAGPCPHRLRLAPFSFQGLSLEFMRIASVKAASQESNHRRLN